TASSAIGAVKLGQPQPDSNLSCWSNSGAPQQMQRKVPACFGKPGCEKARSVPCWRVTRKAASPSCSRHSASVFSIFDMLRLPEGYAIDRAGPCGGKGCAASGKGWLGGAAGRGTG